MSGPVLILFEDNKFKGVGELIRQALADVNGVPGDDVLRFASVNGDGNFANDIARHLHQPVAGEVPRAVLCLADADAPDHLIARAPAVETDVEVQSFCDRWRLHLQGQPHVGDGAERIHTALLRWSQESLWTAVPEAVVSWAARPAIDAHLASCTPDPRGFTGDFLATYKEPQRCLQRVALDVMKRPFKKSHDNDTLGFHAIEHLPLLLHRHPDFAALIRWLRLEIR